MTIGELLAELERRNVRLAIEGDQLAIKAPRGAPGRGLEDPGPAADRAGALGTPRALPPHRHPGGLLAAVDFLGSPRIGDLASELERRLAVERVAGDRDTPEEDWEVVKI